MVEKVEEKVENGRARFGPTLAQVEISTPKQTMAPHLSEPVQIQVWKAIWRRGPRIQFQGTTEWVLIHVVAENNGHFNNLSMV